MNLTNAEKNTIHAIVEQVVEHGCATIHLGTKESAALIAFSKREPTGPIPKVIFISAKCSDLFSATLSDNNGNRLGQDYDEYVPDLQLNIDLETGRILNWKKPTNKQLKETFKF